MERQNNNYIPTDEQIKYVTQENGKIVLNACPGSGKTETVAYKLAKLISKYEINYDTTGIACLSFTNVAKDEIQEKYMEFTGKNIATPHLVSTIDHFINSYITLPFCHKLNKSDKRPKIIEGIDFLDEIYFGNFTNKNNKPLKYIYRPSGIEYEIDGSYSFGGKKPDVNVVDLTIFNNYCEAIKKWQLKNGLLKTSDSAYIALIIIESIPRIAKYLVKRFPHIIIDEAQDTSEIQYAIFDKLIENGLENIEYIGDPYQALYEWRDAKPEIFYKKYSSGNYSPHTFIKCKRSSQNIVNTYCTLRKSDEKDLKSDVRTEELPIYVIKYSKGEEQRVVEKWKKLVNGKYKNNCVLVRGNTLKNNLLGINDEKIEPWKSPIPYKVFKSLLKIDSGEIKKAVSIFREIIPIIEGVRDFQKRKEKEIELKKDHAVNGVILEVLKKCPSFDLELSDWTAQMEILLKIYFPKNEINFELKTGVWNKKYKMKMVDLFNISKNTLGVEVSTIHGVKGRTFDSVLLILSNKHAQTISIDDISEVFDIPNEKQRLIYVAMSRPRHLLSIGIPNRYTDEQIRSKLESKNKLEYI